MTPERIVILAHSLREQIKTASYAEYPRIVDDCLELLINLTQITMQLRDFDRSVIQEDHQKQISNMGKR